MSKHNADNPSGATAVPTNSPIRMDQEPELLHRQALLDSIRAVLSHPPRGGTRLGVLCCEVGGLRPVNDTLGHAVGDRLLADVADLLRTTLRGDDPLGRLGGHEFVALLMSIRSRADAEGVAEKVRTTVGPQIEVAESPLLVTTSVGVTVAEPGDDADTLLCRAAATAGICAETTGSAARLAAGPPAPPPGAGAQQGPGSPAGISTRRGWDG
jgi:diguanylate cyclase